ncbi:hypothetical protein KUCAC02_009602 [Chaenocephalus aceratus]|nr:hypothetical protein KUCAC02_009602 [Chaenocephalus aceratus]
MEASLVFRLHERGPEVVREVLLERGWEEYDEEEREEEDWNLYWRGSAFRNSEYLNLMPWQRLNHHPKTVGITRKDCLARNLRRMRTTFGWSLYNFSPTAFILPNDYTRFLSEYNKVTRGPLAYWICKPVDLSRGRGIFIFEDMRELVYDCPVIVQRYISNPLLISGYKFDLRIYVCVKSFHPLTVYIHQEGLVRFATEKYNLSSLHNLYAHLTNTSINKFSPFYSRESEKERVGRGCKWTMSKFRHFLQSQDINELLLWQRINNIVTLTLLTIAPTVPSCPNCVELLGFDILIDAGFKPWLLEVNYSPALTRTAKLISRSRGGRFLFVTRDPTQGLGFRREKLPDIYSGIRRVRKERPAALNRQHVTPLRVGDFIRTFPFNAATLKASQHTLDVKQVIHELHKLTAQLASRKKLKRREEEEEERDGEEDFDSLLWGPKDPPLLSHCVKPF